MEATAEQQPWAPDLDHVELDDLPASYREVAKHIGLSPALALVAARGGQEVFIHSAPGPGHALVRIVGAAAAALLAERYGSTRVNVPTLGGASIAQRNRAIRAECRAGAAVTALAARYGLSVRTIRAVLRDD